MNIHDPVVCQVALTLWYYAVQRERPRKHTVVTWKAIFVLLGIITLARIVFTFPFLIFSLFMLFTGVGVILFRSHRKNHLFNLQQEITSLRACFQTEGCLDESALVDVRRFLSEVSLCKQLGTNTPKFPTRCLEDTELKSLNNADSKLCWQVFVQLCGEDV